MRVIKRLVGHTDVDTFFRQRIFVTSRYPYLVRYEPGSGKPHHGKFRTSRHEKCTQRGQG